MEAVLTAWLVGFATFGVISGMALIFAVMMLFLSLDGGGLSSYERREIRTVFKVSFVAVFVGLVWPLIIFYVPFLVYYHVFTEERRDKTFPMPPFLSWGRKGVDSTRSSW